MKFILDTEERIGEPVTFEATGPDAAVLLEAFAAYYHDDLGTIHVNDGRSWTGPLCLGGYTNADSFDVFVASFR